MEIKYSSVVVFLLFFGVALFEAVQKQDWPFALIFFALGILSYWADTKDMKRAKKKRKR